MQSGLLWCCPAEYKVLIQCLVERLGVMGWADEQITWPAGIPKSYQESQAMGWGH